MEWFRRMRTKLAGSDRQLQRYLDTMRVYVCTGIYEGLRAQDALSLLQNGSKSRESLEERLSSVSEWTDEEKVLSLSERQLCSHIDKRIHSQISLLFDSVLAVGGLDVYPCSLFARAVRTNSV